MTIEAVIFDWGGTLTPWHTLEPREAWRAAVRDDELAERMWEAELELWRRSQTEHRSGSVADVFEAVGVEPAEHMLAGFREWWEPHTLIDPDAPPLFAALRERGIRIGVLSNTLWTRDEHERIFARDGVLEVLHGAVYSSEIPWTKPHPSAFRAALDAVEVDDPSAAVFVGDRPFEDIHGSRSVGMRAVLVPHSEIPDDQKGPVEGEADAVVQRLRDVLAVVDRLNAEA